MKSAAPIATTAMIAIVSAKLRTTTAGWRAACERTGGGGMSSGCSASVGLFGADRFPAARRAVRMSASLENGSRLMSLITQFSGPILAVLAAARLYHQFGRKRDFAP